VGYGERLTPAEVSALAEAFTEPVQARQLLDDIGIERARQPVGGTGVIANFWVEVSRLLADGAVVDGRARLLAAAAACYPDNPVFRATGQATTSASGHRLRPSSGPLPTLPERFVPRDKDVVAVRNLLTRPGGHVVGVVGMGGSGKSVLARAVVHDPKVKGAFPDGTIWVDVNIDPDVTAVLSTVLRAFGDGLPVRDAAEGTARLTRLVDGAACLLVLDNVWQIDVLRAVRLSSACRVLVTTRNREAIFTDGRIYKLGEADDSTAQALLSTYADCQPTSLPAEADTVLRYCGGLPLALALAGGMVAGGSPWHYVAERLRQADLSWLAGQFADYPHHHLLAALDASVSALGNVSAEAFRELAVFEGKGSVPVAVAVRLWQVTAGMTDLDAHDQMRVLAQRSLVQVDQAAETFTVHDLLATYARRSLPAGRLEALHELLARSFLDRWGGLTEELPGLRAAGDLDTADLYGLARLISHIVAARQSVLLDEVLAAQWPGDSGSIENIWHAVHESLGLTADYLADLRAARHDAERMTDVDPGYATTTGIEREIFYALVLSSVASRAKRIPSSLLVRLVTEELWAPERALAYVDASDVGALASLAAYLPAAHGRKVLSEALASVSRLENQLLQATMIGTLAPHLPPELLSDALTIASRMDDQPARTRALNMMAPHLPAELHSRAVSAIDDTENESGRARALASLAPYLSSPLDAKALTSVRRIQNERFRTEALRGLAPHLSAELLHAALGLAETVNDPYNRSRIIRELLPRLPAELLPDALAIVRGIKLATVRVPLLVVLAQRLPAYRRGAVLGEALTATQRIDHDVSRAEVLAVLAPHLPFPLRRKSLTDVLNTVRRMDRPSSQVDVLVRLARELPVARRDAVLTEGLSAADNIEEPARRTWALQSLARCFPPERQYGVLRKALSATRLIDDEDSRVRALVALAPHLPADLSAEALSVANGTRDDAKRAAAIEGLAPHLPVELFPDAVRSATGIDHGQSRAKALEALAPYLPAEFFHAVMTAAVEIDSVWTTSIIGALAPHLPTVLLSEAVSALGVVGDASFRARVLAALTSYLSAGLQDAVLTEALSVARQDRNRAARVLALAQVASRVPLVRRHALLTEALSLANPVEEISSGTKMWKALAAQMSGQLFPETLSVVSGIASRSLRSQVLQMLAPNMPAELLEDFLTLVNGLENLLSESFVLRQLVPHLQGDQRRSILTKALEVARRFDDPFSRVRVLSELVPYLSAEDSRAVQEEALSVIGSIASTASRERALAILAPYLSGEFALIASSLAREIGDASTRALVLASLTPRLPPVTRREMLDEALTSASDQPITLVQLLPYLPPGRRESAARAALHAIREVESLSDRASMLAALAPNLPPQDFVSAISMARNIPDPNSKGKVLKALAPRLPINLISDFLVAVNEINDSSTRTYTLASIMPHMPAGRRDSIIVEALSAANSIELSSYRSAAFMAISHAAKEEPIKFADTWRQALRAATSAEREDVVGVVLAIAAHCNSNISESAVRSIISVGRCWP